MTVKLKIAILEPHERFLLILTGVGWAGLVVAFFLWGPP